MSDTPNNNQRVLQPPSWPRPRGYANGILTDGRIIVLAGQVGWDAEGRFGEGLPAQVGQALANVRALLAEADAVPRHIRPAPSPARRLPSPAERFEMSDTPNNNQRVLQPPSWPRPRGYANGILTDGRIIVLAGQVGWDAEGRFGEGLPAQVGQALANIQDLLAEAAAAPRHIVRLTWWVTDMRAYRAQQSAIGAAYRRVMGRHFPTMSVIGVTQLVEPEALVEIEATAVLPSRTAPRNALA